MAEKIFFSENRNGRSITLQPLLVILLRGMIAGLWSFTAASSFPERLSAGVIYRTTSLKLPSGYSGLLYR